MLSADYKHWANSLSYQLKKERLEQVERILSASLAAIVGIFLALGTVPLDVSAAPLWATLHTYHEQPGQTTYRSKQSLRDRHDLAWQTILFKRFQDNQLQGIYLRLVGFPRMAEVEAQKPITIETGTGIRWQVPPQLDAQTISLPTNAAQYDVQILEEKLTGDIPLQLLVPLKGGQRAEVVVPPFAVHEWREMFNLSRL